MSEIQFPLKNISCAKARRRYFQNNKESKAIKQLTRNEKLNAVIFICLALAFLAGVVYGAVCYCGENASGLFLKGFTAEYIKMRSQQAYGAISSGCFFSAIISYFIIMLFAYWGLGVPFIAAVIFFKGITVGALSAYLYSSLKYNGILLNLIEYMPWNILSAAAMLIFSVGCCKSSIFLFKNGIMSTHTPEKYNAISVFYRFIVVSAVTIPISFLSNAALLF